MCDRYINIFKTSVAIKKSMFLSSKVSESQIDIFPYIWVWNTYLSHQGAEAHFTKQKFFKIKYNYSPSVPGKYILAAQDKKKKIVWHATNKHHKWMLPTGSIWLWQSVSGRTIKLSSQTIGMIGIVDYDSEIVNTILLYCGDYCTSLHCRMTLLWI